MIVVLLVALQLGLVATSVGAHFRDREPKSDQLVRLETGVPPGTALSIETALPGALIYAREWADDAYLFATSMQIDWPTEPGKASSTELPNAGWIIYTFGSARDETLSIMVDRLSGAVFDEQRMKWSGRPSRQIVNTTYPISSTTALFATETSLGAAFRQACPEFRHISRVSFVPQGSDADGAEGVGGYWLVSYEDSRTVGRPAFTVRIDAENGAVDREDISTDEVANCDS
jgi:hypothetical protein